MWYLLTDPSCNSCSPQMLILRTASVNSWFYLPKILFSPLHLILFDIAQKWAHKDAKHKKLLKLLCTVYNVLSPFACGRLEESLTSKTWKCQHTDIRAIISVSSTSSLTLACQLRLLSSADNLCKKFGSWSGSTECQVLSDRIPNDFMAQFILNKAPAGD